MVRAVFALFLLIPLVAGAQPAGKRGENKEASSGPGRVFRDCPTCPEMVVVPPGEFMMGSPASEAGRDKNEGPQRKVTMRQPFAVGKFEVTFAEWDACVAEGACTHKPGDETWGRGKRPVINVSWNDATEYAGWLVKKTGKPYRLLTEAEWEYAARAVTVTSSYQPFSTGPTIGYRQANYDANFKYGNGQGGLYRQKTQPVGSFKPNAFGVYDVHGNVWEWVQDCYKESYEGAPTDGSAVASGSCAVRILRGGSWNYHPRQLRSAYRYASAATVRTDFFGFRVARAL